MSGGSGFNPFDNSDDANPFGQDSSSGLEHYDPFSNEPQQKPASPPPVPARPISPAASTSNEPSLDFHNTDYLNDPVYGSGTTNNMMSATAATQGEELPQDTDAQIIGLEQPQDEEAHEEDPGVFSVAFYQRLFNVDTIQVLDRIFRSCVPFRTNYLEVTKKNPDLYGVIWLSATLVFILASVGNFANYIYHLMTPGSIYTYNFNKLPFGALAVYLYVGLVPLLLWAALTWLDDFPLTLAQSYCLYGYALALYIPAGIACGFPNQIVKWVSIAIAFVGSFAHIFLSLWPVLTLRKLIQLITYICLAAAHVGITLAFALYFFNYEVLKVNNAA